MKRKISITAIIIALAVVSVSCKSNQADASNPQIMADASASIVETIDKADPEMAVKEIYATLDGRVTKQLDGEGLGTVMGIAPVYVQSFIAYTSDPNSGLCDIVIIKPAPTGREKVRNFLFTYKEKRIEEFINFNILDSYQIAQDASIYDQGDYVIMLMLPDNQAASEIVDKYIPQ